jgi:hypothetical protein
MSRQQAVGGRQQPERAQPPGQQVPLLSRSQIGRFKRDGYLILEGVLDPKMCGRLRVSDPYEPSAPTL